MSKIAGVVIVFFPDVDKLIFNIDTYIDQIEQLFIVFNSPVSTEVIKKIQNKYAKVQLIINKNNIGIASALNQMALKSLNEGFEWLLTMDQDSSFLTDHFFEAFRRSTIKNAAIFSPATGLSSLFSDDKSYETEEVLNVITSGNLLNLKIWKTIGGFEDKLFIDEVDNDYCLKAVLNGFKIISFKNIQLIHELGVNEEVSFLFRKYTVITHPPIRAYYIFRNNFYIFNKYRKPFPGFVKSRKIMLFKVLIKILLFSEFRVQNCKYIFSGISDYFRKCYGPFKDEIKKIPG